MEYPYSVREKNMCQKRTPTRAAALDYKISAQPGEARDPPNSSTAAI